MQSEQRFAATHAEWGEIYSLSVEQDKIFYHKNLSRDQQDFHQLGQFCGSQLFVRHYALCGDSYTLHIERDCTLVQHAYRTHWRSNLNPPWLRLMHSCGNKGKLCNHMLFLLTLIFMAVSTSLQVLKTNMIGGGGGGWRGMEACTLGCSDFYFFHILRYNHPSLTP